MRLEHCGANTAAIYQIRTGVGDIGALRRRLALGLSLKAQALRFIDLL